MSEEKHDDDWARHLTNRHHMAIAEIHQYFGYDHLPEGVLRETSKRFYYLIDQLGYLPSTGETVECMRKLLEAKDCAVRAALHISSTT